MYKYGYKAKNTAFYHEGGWTLAQMPKEVVKAQRGCEISVLGVFQSLTDPKQPDITLMRAGCWKGWSR